MSLLRQLYACFLKEENFESILSCFSQLSLACNSPQTPPFAVYASLRDLLIAEVPASSGLFKILDSRFGLKEYATPSEHAAVCIVGTGPAGLRTAIECCLLKCPTVVVLEKRKSFQRNNVLHLWPFVIQDLKQLGGKEIYRKIGIGEFDHLSIWRLQTIYLKLALILGTRVYPGVQYLETRSLPLVDGGWGFGALTEPPLLEEVRFNVLVGAEGEKSRVVTEFGFTTKIFYSSPSLGITANFDHVPGSPNLGLREGGFISYANAKFFQGLRLEHSIILENLVYYCAETHYFVMTVKLDTLLGWDVLKKSGGSLDRLLESENVDLERLKQLVRVVTEAYGLPPEVEMTKTPQGKDDCCLFDFTNKRACERPSKLWYPYRPKFKPAAKVVAEERKRAITVPLDKVSEGSGNNGGSPLLLPSLSLDPAFTNHPKRVFTAPASTFTPPIVTNGGGGEGMEEKSNARKLIKPTPLTMKRIGREVKPLKSPFLEQEQKRLASGDLSPHLFFPNTGSPRLLSPSTPVYLERRRSWNPPLDNFATSMRRSASTPGSPARSPLVSSDEDSEPELLELEGVDPLARKRQVLLIAITGDALLEPFWPMGTGAANASLSAQDAAWTIKGFSEYLSEVQSEVEEKKAERKKREKELLRMHRNAFRVLQISTADSLRKTEQYTIDPASRYNQL